MHPASASVGLSEDPCPSLSDFHDYEPKLEFDDTEVHASHSGGKLHCFY